MIAADLMTEHPTTIRHDATLAEARRVLEELDVRHLPVVDETGELIGMLSDRDLAGRGLDPDAPSSGLKVAELMSGGVLAVEPDADVREIAEVLLENHVGAVPVIDDDVHVVGIVSYVDVLREAVAKPTEAEPRRRAKRRRI